MALPVSKALVLLNQVSETAAGTDANGTIDTLGYDFCSLDVLMATSDAVSNNPSTLTVSESDDTVVSNFADITAFVGDTAFTIPDAITAATSITGPFAKFDVDCRGRKRYLRVEVVPLTTQVISIIGNLHRGEELPNTTAKSGATVYVAG